MRPAPHGQALCPVVAHPVLNTALQHWCALQQTATSTTTPKKSTFCKAMASSGQVRNVAKPYTRALAKYVPRIATQTRGSCSRKMFVSTVHAAWHSVQLKIPWTPKLRNRDCCELAQQCSSDQAGIAVTPAGSQLAVGTEG